VGKLYRLGGDEFAVTLLVDEDANDIVTTLADRLVLEVAAPFRVGRFSHHISASIGIACFPVNAATREELLQQADIAMYYAKSRGRSRHSVYETSMGESLVARAELEREIRGDLGSKAFQPFYQPIVDLLSGRIIGFEMLARWRRADGSMGEPARFIPIMEECGLIDDFMLQLLEQACRDARHWPPELTVAINLSPVQFRDPWLANKILAVFAKQDFPARRVCFEVTEMHWFPTPLQHVESSNR